MRRWKKKQITREKVQKLVRWTFSALLFLLVRGRRQAHNPTLAKILRLTYNRSCSHNRPQTAACNAVYSMSRRALLITRLGEQLPRPRQVSMTEKSLVASFQPSLLKGSYGSQKHTHFFFPYLFANLFFFFQFSFLERAHGTGFVVYQKHGTFITQSTLKRFPLTCGLYIPLFTLIYGMKKR